MHIFPTSQSITPQVEKESGSASKRKGTTKKKKKTLDNIWTMEFNFLNIRQHRIIKSSITIDFGVKFL
jgi:hypothetical protein